MIELNATQFAVYTYYVNNGFDFLPPLQETADAIGLRYKNVQGARLDLYDLGLLTRDKSSYSGVYFYRMGEPQDVMLRPGERLRGGDGIARTYAQMARYGY